MIKKNLIKINSHSKSNGLNIRPRGDSNAQNLINYTNSIAVKRDIEKNYALCIHTPNSCTCSSNAEPSLSLDAIIKMKANWRRFE